MIFVLRRGDWEGRRLEFDWPETRLVEEEKVEE